MDDAYKLLEEKYKNLAEKLDQEKKDKEKLIAKFDKLEDKVLTVEKNLGSDINTINVRLTQLDVQFKEFAKTTTDKLDNYSREVRDSNKQIENKLEAMSSVINAPKKELFKDWLLNLAMKLLEWGAIVAIGYALVDKLK